VRNRLQQHDQYRQNRERTIFHKTSLYLEERSQATAFAAPPAPFLLDWPSPPSRL